LARSQRIRERCPLRYNEVLQLFHCEPQLGAVDHPVAVRAQQRQVGQPGLRPSRDVQRRAVMAFDVVRAMEAVRLAEVEVAHLARDGKAAPLGIRELTAAQARITLTLKMSTERKISFASSDVS
jgi:hypothetical protein